MTAPRVTVRTPAEISTAAGPERNPARRLADRLRSGWRDWIARLARPGRAEPQLLSVVGRLPLGKKSLMLVASGRQRFLVASNAETISAMIEIGPARPALARQQRPAGARSRPSAGRRGRAMGRGGSGQLGLPIDGWSGARDNRSARAADEQWGGR